MISILVDFQSYSDVLKITIPNFLKLTFVIFLVFIVLPKYIFPQKHITNKLDSILYNLIFMLASIVTIVPLLIVLHIFSIITLFLSFLLLKAALLYIFEKKNLFKIIRASYPPLFIKLLNKLDAFYFYISSGNFKEYKKLISYKKFFDIDFLYFLLVTIFFIYAVLDINLINIVSLSNKTSDVSQFIEWVANLHKQILYANHKTGGADFFGLAIIVFFFQVLTNIDSVLLFSLYPTFLFLFILFGIYYVVYKITDSKYSALFALVIYVLYCLSPVGEYITGKLLVTANPPIKEFLGLKFYFTTYEAFKVKKDLINIAYSPYIRINSGLAYEISSGFFLLNLYFLIMSFWKKENIYILLYTLTLYLVFVFHGGGAFLLFVSSVLIFLNALIFGKINFKILKKGAVGIFIAAVLGNLWILSWLKYGIPQDFGNAAPILDKIFKTQNSIKQVVKIGKEFVEIVVFYRYQLFLFLLMSLIYPVSLLTFSKKKFLLSSISLSIIAVIFIFTEENLGFPRIVSQVRCADYLFIVTTLSAGIYFGFFEKYFLKFFGKIYKWIMVVVLSFFIICSAMLIPCYNETESFYEFTNSEQYNSIAFALYNIKKQREPYTYTVVGFVQSFSKVMDKGFHINVADFLQKYNPYAPELKINTKYIYIILETIPMNYAGLGEWYYRWRKDIELALASWIDIYSKYHNNIRVYFNRKYVTIYEIDNREYTRKIFLENLKKKRKKLMRRN